MKAPASVAGAGQHKPSGTGDDQPVLRPTPQRGPLRQRVTHSPGRLSIEGRRLDSQGRLAQLSDEPASIDFVSLAHETRAAALQQAPRDLETLGVPHARLRWERAVDELHRQHDQASKRGPHQWLVIRLMIEIWRVMDSHGPDCNAPALDDIREATLRLGAAKDL